MLAPSSPEKCQPSFFPASPLSSVGRDNQELGAAHYIRGTRSRSSDDRSIFNLSSKQISENCLSNLGVKRMLPSPSLLALQGILGLGK